MVSGGVLSKADYFAAVGYSPHDAQWIVHDSTARFRVLSNGRRWGKTYMGGYEYAPHAYVPCPITGKAQIGWVVGPQYDDAEREFGIIYDTLKKQGVERESIKFLNNPESGSLHIKTNWGFELLGKSAAYPERLVGEGLNFVLMVEAGRHKRKTWTQYIRPTLSDRLGEAFFTGVPEGRSEHSLLYALWQRGQSSRYPGWASWRMPSWTNLIAFPGGRRDPEILDAESDLTTDEFNRQYGAMFVDKVGAVMQDWDDDVHLADLEYRHDWPLYAAVDYGFTNDFVWLWVQAGPNGEVHVIGERRWNRMQTGDIGRELLYMDGPLVRNCAAFYPDPAEPDRTLELQNMLQIPARSNTGGPINTRLSLMWKDLKIQHPHLPDGHPEKVPLLRIDRTRCQKLTWEMREGYRWPEHKSEVKSESELPLDKDNHGPEALSRFYKGHKGLTGIAESRVRKARVG
jgi:hypothetical protein